MINREIRILCRKSVVLNRDSRNSTREVWLARLTAILIILGMSCVRHGKGTTFKNNVYQEYSFWDCEDVGVTLTTSPFEYQSVYKNIVAGIICPIRLKAGRQSFTFATGETKYSVRDREQAAGEVSFVDLSV